MLSILIFSKDRPLQLHSLLYSIDKNYIGRSVNITVLCKITQKFEDSYNRIKTSFPKVNFLVESNFAKQVADWLLNVKTDFFAFGCDDVLVTNKVNLGYIEEFMKQNPDVIGFSPRLGQNVTFCQPSNSVMDRVPEKFDDLFLCWDYKQYPFTWDWGYPFDVATTIYRNSLIPLILAFPYDVLSHPNKIEGPISLYIREHVNYKLASFHKSKTVTITVNRVQDVATNTIFDIDLSLDDIEEKYKEGFLLDFSYYSKKEYPSICIGDFVIKHAIRS